MTVEVSSITVNFNTGPLNAGTQALNNVGQAAGQAAGQINNRLNPALQNNIRQNNAATQAAQANTRAMRQQGQMATNAAFQVGDFFVQISSGTSAFVAAAQQLPQLLGVFGTAGAIAGAVAAITFAIAGPLVKALFDAEHASKELEKAIDGLNGVMIRTSEDAIDFSEKFRQMADISLSAARTYARAEAVLMVEVESKRKMQVAKLINDLDKMTKEWEVTTFRFMNVFTLPTIRRNALDEFLDSVEENAKKTKKPIHELVEEFVRINKLDINNPKIAKLLTEIMNLGHESKRAQEELKKLMDFANTGNLPESEGEAKNRESFASAMEKDLRRARETLAKIQSLNEKSKQSFAKIAEIQEADDNKVTDKFLSSLERDLKLRKSRTLTHYEEMENKLREHKRNMNNITLEESERLAAVEAEINRVRMEDMDAQNASFNEMENARRQERNELIIDGFAQVGDAMQRYAGENQDLANLGFAISQAAAVAGMFVQANVAYAAITAAGAQRAALNPMLYEGEIAASQAQANLVRGMIYASAVMTAGLAVGELAAGRKQGGDVRAGRPYLVGESGPELVMFNKPGSVIPNHAMGSGNQNVTTNVIIKNAPAGAEVTRNRTMLNDRTFVENVVVDLVGNQSSRLMTALTRSSNVQLRGRI